MRTFRIPAVVAVTLGLCALTAWALAWPLERALYLAPVIVVGAAALAGLVILWGKIVYQALRESRRPRLVIALWVLGLALIVVLTILGVKLPREG